jgi:single-strand DNA-binding protein
MPSINKAIIIGHLGSDPEVRSTKEGTSIANFNVATTEKWTAKDGNVVDNTEWHRVVVFGKPAEFAEKYLRKGSLVYIEGSIQTRKWEDKEGVTRYTTEIKAQSVQGLDRKEGGGGRPPHSADSLSSKAVGADAPDKPNFDDMDDDLPF